jgi:LEA14-like dessication related protein
MNATRTLVALAGPALLAACAYSHLQQPELSVVDVDLLKADLFQQELRVRMRVRNPNDVDLRVRSIVYAVELAGRAFAHGESTGDFVIPAKGEAAFDVSATANAAGALLRLLTSGDQGNPEYRISGEVRLSSSLLRRLPFEHTGTLQLH